MSEASALIQDASNRLADYSGNASSAATDAVLLAMTIVDLLKPVHGNAQTFKATGIAIPGALDIGNAPALFTDTYQDAGYASTAPDLGGIMEANYWAAEAPAKNAIDNAINAFISQQCPGYLEDINSFRALAAAGANIDVNSLDPQVAIADFDADIVVGLVGKQVSDFVMGFPVALGPLESGVTDAELDALLTRMENGLDDDRRAEQAKIGREPTRGHEDSLFLAARFDLAEQDYNDRLAKARTETYVQGFQLMMERVRLALSKLQITQGVILAIRQLALSAILGDLDKLKLDISTALAVRGLTADKMKLLLESATLSLSAVKSAWELRQENVKVLQAYTDNNRSVFLQFAGIVAGFRSDMLGFGKASADAAGAAYQSEIAYIENKRSASLTVLEAGIKRSSALADIWKTEIEAKSSALRLQYEGLNAQIKLAEIPYEGELRRFLTAWQMELTAYEAAGRIHSERANMLGHIAESLASGINALAQVAATE